MITYKSNEDFMNMKKAGKIVATIHAELQNISLPGTKIETLDKKAEEIIKKSNAVSNFLNYRGFPSYICASPNDVIVHGIPKNFVIEEGDILSIDVGCTVNGFHADAALTYGIGQISSEDKKLIDVTKKALYEAIKLVKDGQKLGTIGNKIEKIGKKNSYGVVREYVGHGIGLEMHEDPQVPNYGIKNKGFKLKKGMAICIEPMFNLGTADTKVDADGWTVRTADGKKSAHWEHVIGIMEDEVCIFSEL